MGEGCVTPIDSTSRLNHSFIAIILREEHNSVGSDTLPSFVCCILDKVYPCFTLGDRLMLMPVPSSNSNSDTVEDVFKNIKLVVEVIEDYHLGMILE